MRNTKQVPHVLILGTNCAGLGTAHKFREYAAASVDITVIDRKSFLLFVPNIPADVFEGRNPAIHQRMDVIGPLTDEGSALSQGEVTGIDVEKQRAIFVLSERYGAETQSIDCDYVVIAVGNRLQHDLDNEYRGGPIAILLRSRSLRVARNALISSLDRFTRVR